MNISRLYKLKTLGAELSKDKLDILDMFDSNFLNLRLIRFKEHPNYKCYFKHNKCVCYVIDNTILHMNYEINNNLLKIFNRDYDLLETEMIKFFSEKFSLKQLNRYLPTTIRSIDSFKYHKYESI